MDQRIIDNLFKEKTITRAGEIIAINGNRYTLKTKTGKTYFVFSSGSYKLYQWVYFEGETIKGTTQKPKNSAVFDV